MLFHFKSVRASAMVFDQIELKDTVIVCIIEAYGYMMCDV